MFGKLKRAVSSPRTSSEGSGGKKFYTGSSSKNSESACV
jgi:hypothetical protein